MSYVLLFGSGIEFKYVKPWWDIEPAAVSVNCMTYAQRVINGVFQPQYLVKTVNIVKDPVSLFGVRKPYN